MVNEDPVLKRLIRKSQHLVAAQLSSFCNESLDLTTGVPRWVIPGGLAADPDAAASSSRTGQATSLFAERMGAIRLKAVDYSTGKSAARCGTGLFELETAFNTQCCSRLTTPSASGLEWRVRVSGDAALVLRHTALVLEQTRAAAIEDNREHMADMSAASTALPRSAAQSANGLDQQPGATAALAALPRSAAQSANSRAQQPGAIAASAALPRSAAQSANARAHQPGTNAAAMAHNHSTWANLKSNEWCARCRVTPIRPSTERDGSGGHRACRAKDGLCKGCANANK